MVDPANRQAAESRLARAQELLCEQARILGDVRSQCEQSIALAKNAHILAIEEERNATKALIDVLTQ